MMRFFAAVLSLLIMLQAHAGPIRLLLESDVDDVGGSEIFLATFDTFNDLLDFNLSSSAFSQVDISPGFSVGGLAYDSGAYRLLLESDADDVGGSEIFLATFDTFNDLLDFNLSSSAFSQVDISPGFSVGGFAYDSGAYRLLLESDVDDTGGSEIFLATFDTFTDLVNFTLSDSAFSQLDISPGFSVGGFAYDSGAYQLLLESDTDDVGGSEIFLATFNSFNDLLDFNVGSSAFSQVDISPGFSVGGLAYQTVPQSVPEPSQLGLLGIGLLGLILMGRRRAA